MHIIGTETKIIHYPVWKNMDKLWITCTALTEAFMLRHRGYKKEESINIYCTGTSGITMALIMEKKLKDAEYPNINICYVRRPNETHHDSVYKNEHYAGTNIIIDDFTSTGATVDYIIEINNRVTFDYLIVDDILVFKPDWPIKNIIFNSSEYKSNILNKINADRFIVKDDKLVLVELFG